MILKVEDALKQFSRTDPDCEAHRDLRVIFPTSCCDIKNSPIYTSTVLLRGY